MYFSTVSTQIRNKDELISLLEKEKGGNDLMSLNISAPEAIAAKGRAYVAR